MSPTKPKSFFELLTKEVVVSRLYIPFVSFLMIGVLIGITIGLIIGGLN